jgi:poly(3-hydroxybutyrate) depolymerase
MIFKKTSLTFLSVALLMCLSEGAAAAWKNLQHVGSEVHLYIPKKSAQNSKRSLMINLHGCAQKGEVLKLHGNWEDAANEFNAVVAIPEVPGGGVYAGCWDYYGLNHRRSNRHNKFILSLVESIKSLYNINPHKVYISGLSSGGGLAHVLGCLAPEVFAGVGLNAAPAVGSSAGQISRASLDVEEIKKNCLRLAANKRQHLQGQIASIIFGDNDYIVDPEYGRRIGKALSELYRADSEKSFDVGQYPGTNSLGSGLQYSRNNMFVVSVIENTGLGHNWPAGQGGNSPIFVNKKSLNYPYYLLKFFAKNNRRP